MGLLLLGGFCLAGVPEELVFAEAVDWDPWVACWFCGETDLCLNGAATADMRRGEVGVLITDEGAPPPPEGR